MTESSDEYICRLADDIGPLITDEEALELVHNLFMRRPGKLALLAVVLRMLDKESGFGAVEIILVDHRVEQIKKVTSYM